MTSGILQRRLILIPIHPELLDSDQAFPQGETDPLTGGASQLFVGLPMVN